MSPNLIILNGRSDAARRSRREPGALVCQVDSRTLARDGASVQVPRPVFIFIAAVTAHPGAILCSAELTDLLYGEQADGGPDGPGASIDTLAYRARPALAALGYRLELNPTRGRFVRCCISPTPVTYAALAADQELSYGQA